MNTKHLLLVAIFLFGGLISTHAQKYGHLNFGTLLASLPETTAADSTLEAYQKALTTELDTKTKAWQDKAKSFVAEVQSGNLSRIVQQEREEGLEKERNALVAEQQAISQKVQQKRQELLGPIVARAETAINAVAEEKGYLMIFDTSTFNAILFAKDSDDVYELVKAKI